MGNYASITNQTSGVLIANNVTGLITDIDIVAGAGATGVALYDGQTTSAPLIFINKVATGGGSVTTNHKIQFVSGGIYAVVDANTQALIVHGEWGKKPASNVLSGG